ncbi:annexin-2 receptor-like [Balaenoptera musculus]|uniref:Annexin-2 receptor-like n=1 Tax=Balaenoptera musculus TaxID=9771 RepID=A0A8B8X0S6_BALMU|nr:annexin-2 receptor-like [Balaenoptera musculus]
MEPNFPRCVREAWDSAEESQEPEMLQILSLADPEEWQLPFYPTLGQLSGDDEDFDGDQLSTPCGRLHPHCPKHGPRAQSTCRRGAGPPAPDTTPSTRQEPQSPSGGGAAARPQSFPGRVLRHRGPNIWNPRPLTAGTLPEHRPPPGLERHHRTSQGWWPRTYTQWPGRPWAASPAAFGPRSPHLR